MRPGGEPGGSPRRLEGSLEILDVDAAEGGIAAVGFEREDGLAVQVLHEATAEPRVVAELLGVHALPDHFGEDHLRRQMAYPARHQMSRTTPPAGR